MTSFDLKVQDREQGYARKKGAFIVEWEGVWRRVPMFEFQESEETPETILCNVDRKDITQDVRTLYDRFYPEKDASYIFEVRRKCEGAKFYEVIDPRMEKDGIKQKLMFSQSSTDLEMGQTLKCSIKGFRGGKLILHFEEAIPIGIDFHTLDSIFDESVRGWLETLFARPQFSDIWEMYEAQDGRWIILFAREIEKIAYCIVEERDDRNVFLRGFCTDWLKAVEHSTFITDMNEQQTQAYSADIVSSIEICEDFIDALNVPDMDDKVCESIEALDPGYFQFRVEKRFRFLACAFSLYFSRLKKNLQPLSEKLGAMGEEKCREGSVGIALNHILRLCGNELNVEVEKFKHRLTKAVES